MAGRIELKPQTDAEAVRYLIQKQVGARLSFDWRDVREAEHVTSFVVAKAMGSSILTDIHDELVVALSQGRTLAQFTAELKPKLQAKGWWGKQAVTDPTTGEIVNAQLGSSRRLQTIYDVNLRMAHAAGRWERLTRAARPGDLLRYRHTPQAHPRVSHQAWDGITLPVDHPFWSTHYCPNGWRCKCYILFIPRTQAARENFFVTSDEDLVRRGYGKTTPWLNRRTGEIEQIPYGVDPGFAYNVGQARLRAFSPSPEEVVAARAAPQVPGRQALYEQSKAVIPDMPAPRPFVGRVLADDIADEDAVTSFLAAFDGRSQVAAAGELVFTDAAQVPLAISRSLFVDRASGELKVGKRGRKAFLPVLAQTIIDPDEIWASFEELRDVSGQVVARGWRRRYLGRWVLPGSKQEAMLVTFEEDGDGWTGVTAYPPGQGASAGKQGRNLESQGRSGVLIYRRGGLGD